MIEFSAKASSMRVIEGWLLDISMIHTTHEIYESRTLSQIVVAVVINDLVRAVLV